MHQWESTHMIFQPMVWSHEGRTHAIADAIMRHRSAIATRQTGIDAQFFFAEVACGLAGGACVPQKRNTLVLRRDKL